MANFFHITLFRPLLNLTVWLVAVLPGHNLGLAVVVVTLVVRALLYSFSLASIRSQIKTQQIQPLLNRIRVEYKHDQKKQSEEMMRIYREEKVNPYGGCLPLLIQLPVLFVLYAVFRTNLTTIPAHDLYSITPHLTTIQNSWFGLDLTARHAIRGVPQSGADLAIILIALIAAATQYWQVKMMQPKTLTAGDQAGQMARQMSIMMPLVSFLIALSLPPALPIYWIVTTLFTVGQQYAFFRRGQLTPARAEVVADDALGEDAPLPSQPTAAIRQEKRGDVTITIRRRS